MLPTQACCRIPIRSVLPLLAALGIAACQGPLPTSQAGSALQGRTDPRKSAPPEPALRAAYLQSVQKQAGPEYALTAESSLNPAQGLQVWLDAQGLRLRSTAIPSHPQVAMSLHSYGCAQAPRPAGLVVPVGTQAANRMEYRREGVTEWYVNGPLGLEQGFTVEKELGCGGSAALAFTLTLGGELTPALVGTGAAAHLELQERLSGRSLRYGDLFAYDADGKELESRLVLAEGRVRIEVQADGARYPVTVDPLWNEQAQLIASDGAADDRFGISVSVSGDTAVVGAHFKAVGGHSKQGQAYVYVRSGSGWTEQARLTASDGAADDYFGLSVSVSGDTAVVGADVKTVGGHSQQGQAYVYVRSGSVWTEQARLTASDGAADDYFGLSVSVSGDTAVVGADSKTVGGHSKQGQAYVYVRSGSVWTEQAQLTASDGAADDSFGRSVSVSGDTAIVSAPDKAVGGYLYQGQAYVYVRSGSAWTEQARLTASDGEAYDFFGGSVSLSGDTAVFGVRKTVSGHLDQGQAYVYVRSGSAWTEQARLTASDGAANDIFGKSVSVSGDTAVVGAYFKTVGGHFKQGQAYVYVRSGSAWTEQARLLASDGVDYDYFGWSVSVNGDTAVVGAEPKTVGGHFKQGQAYVFGNSPLSDGTPCTLGRQCASTF